MASSQDHVGRVVPHKDYFLRGGDLNVLVGNHLYRVHSYFFYRESLAWRQMLEAPADSEEHSSTDTPFTLDDVKSEDFERFLWVIYNPQYSIYDAPTETWLSIINLAHRWSFCNIKDLAIRELEKLNIDPIEKIAAYHEYKINKTLLLPAYIAVCKRDKPISLAEGMTLGMETVLRIADARERARQQAAESGIRSPTFDDFEELELEDMVREVFGVSPRAMSPVRHSRNPSGAFGDFGKTTVSTAQKANGEAIFGMNGNGPESAKRNGSFDALRVSTGVAEPASANGLAPKVDKKPQAPPKDDKLLPLELNGSTSQQDSSASADNKGGAGSKLNGGGPGKGK